MQVTKILSATTVQELRSVGSYREVKRSLEGKLGIKLGVVGWESLFYKIKHLKKVVTRNKNILFDKCRSGVFKESKRDLEELLELKIKARGWQGLNKKIQDVVNIFCSNRFNPYEYYENKKSLNFKNSSRLEGIDLSFSNETVSLESVLAKYERQTNG